MPAPHNCVAEELDTLKQFSLYTVSSASMQKVFDEIIDLAEECPYFYSLNKEYYLSVALDSNEFTLDVFPLNVNSIIRSTNNNYVSSFGVCFYKKKLIVVCDYSKIQTIDTFFVSMDTVVDLVFESNDNLFDLVFPTNSQIRTYYSFENGTIMQQFDIGDVDAWCGGNDRNMFEYVVRKGDTWKSIAKKCGSTETELRQEFPEFDAPIPGFFIILFYILDESGKSFKITRIDD